MFLFTKNILLTLSLVSFFRLDYEFIAKGYFFHKGRMKVTVSKLFKVGRLTLQEMCCGFLLSREMWYRKSVLPGTGAG